MAEARALADAARSFGNEAHQARVGSSVLLALRGLIRLLRIMRVAGWASSFRLVVCCAVSITDCSAMRATRTAPR